VLTLRLLRFVTCYARDAVADTLNEAFRPSGVIFGFSLLVFNLPITFPAL
jgi:hypothetical protein